MTGIGGIGIAMVGNASTVSASVMPKSGIAGNAGELSDGVGGMGMATLGKLSTGNARSNPRSGMAGIAGCAVCGDGGIGIEIDSAGSAWRSHMVRLSA